MHGNLNYQDDEEAAVRDGRYVRVPMVLMDSLQRAVAGASPFARDGLTVRDAYGGTPGHKPGYCFAGDKKAEQRLSDAYAEYDRQLVDRWRNPSTATASADGKPPAPAAMSDAERREAAYRLYDQQLTERWIGAA
jgi:hypothetical protein